MGAFVPKRRAGAVSVAAQRAQEHEVSFERRNEQFQRESLQREIAKAARRAQAARVQRA